MPINYAEINRRALDLLLSTKKHLSFGDKPPLAVNAQGLSHEETQSKQCPECQSENVYRCKETVDTTTIGGEMLPKLSSSHFSSAKILPVICGDCGYLRNFVEKEALAKLESSKNWEKF